MRLLEAIVEANHRAVAVGAKATLNLAEFADALPVVALTCIDPRLNRLIPEMLGVPEEQFIWLRNAGNIITGPLSSTMRSLTLACAIKGGKEIALVGHMPNIGELAAALIGTTPGNVGFAKGATMAIDFETHPGIGRGLLCWFATAKLLGC